MLGNSMIVKQYDHSLRNLTKQSLEANGYQSVIYSSSVDPKPTYVIYDWNQASLMSAYPTKK